MAFFENIQLNKASFHRTPTLYEGLRCFKDQNGIKIHQQEATLGDTEEVGLPGATQGFALVTDGTEYLLVFIDEDGSVVGMVTSTNADVADTDANLCVYDGGDAQAMVKNQLGAEATVSILYFFFV